MAITPDIHVRLLLSRQKSIIFQNHLISVPDYNPQLKAGQPGEREMERQETAQKTAALALSDPAARSML